MNRTPAQQDPASASPPEHFPAGIEDVVIVPLVVLAVAVKWVLRAILRFLIRLIDWLFPILLQLMRFPLFTLRILGDGIAAISKAVVGILPVGSTKRSAWREAISATWAWLRAKISYHAFEEWVHHAFENGMAWVFKTCRTLSPRTALLVLIGAILWLPVSFGAATLLHAVLIAKATVLPAWMQLLHPVATIIAKSKLLVLPVYPAAWPRAKEHPIVQALARFWVYISTLYLARKTGARYRQADGAVTSAKQALRQSAEAAGLAKLGNDALDLLNRAAAAIGRGVRDMLLWLVERLGKIPLFGGIVRRYEQHYEDVNRHPKPVVSERVSDFYARWSVKFTAKYYEDREREEAAAKGHAA
jgi:hypothetical protein